MRVKTAQDFKAAYPQAKEAAERAVFRMESNPDTQAEIVQDALLTAWEKREQFLGECEFSTWVYRIALNAMKNHIEYNRRHKRRGEAVELDFEAVDYETPEQLAQAAELHRAISVAHNGLGAKGIQAFGMHYFQGLPQQEISEVLGVPKETVKSRIRLGRNALMCALSV